jgi:hypothetical protein
MSSVVAPWLAGALVVMEVASADVDTPNKCHCVPLVPAASAAWPLVAVSAAALVADSVAVVDSVVTEVDLAIAEDLVIEVDSVAALEVGMVEEDEVESDISPTATLVLPKEPHLVHAVVEEDSEVAVLVVVVTTIGDPMEEEGVTATAVPAAPTLNLWDLGIGNVAAVAIAIAATVTAKVGMEAEMTTHESEPMKAATTTILDQAGEGFELLRLFDCPRKCFNRLDFSTASGKGLSESIPCSFAFFPFTLSERYHKYGNAPKSMATQHSTIGQVWVRFRFAE